AELVEAAAALPPPRRSPLLVVAAQQAGEWMACSAAPQTRRRREAPRRSVLRPRFGRGVLPALLPRRLRGAEAAAAPSRAWRGSRRRASSRCLGENHSPPPRAATSHLSGRRFHRPCDLLGQANGPGAPAADRASGGARLGRGALPGARFLRIHALRLFS